MFTLLEYNALAGTCHQVEDGRIPKDLLYGELASGKRPFGRPKLRYKDTSKCDPKSLATNTTTCEAVTADRCARKQEVQRGISQFEEYLSQRADEE